MVSQALQRHGRTCADADVDIAEVVGFVCGHGAEKQGKSKRFVAELLDDDLLNLTLHFYPSYLSFYLSFLGRYGMIAAKDR